MRKIFAILFVFGISVIVTARGKRGLRDLGFLTHVQRTKEFECKNPQLRSIPVRDLLSQPNSEEEFYPSSTVLARCDEHTGCCSEGQICAPADMTEVELVFIVNHVIDTDRLKHHEIIKAKNHTRCHCVTDST